MRRFQDIKLNISVDNYWFYSIEFKNEVVSKLTDFKNNLVDVLKLKYSETKIPDFFESLEDEINELNVIYKELTDETEKCKKKSQLLHIYKIRQTYTDKIFELTYHRINSILGFASSGDSEGLKLYTGKSNREWDFEKISCTLKSNNDFKEAYDNIWSNELKKFGDILTTQAVNYDNIVKDGLPFPTYSIESKVFKLHKIWNNTCRSTLDISLRGLREDINKMTENEPHFILRFPLRKILEKAQIDISSAYNILNTKTESRFQRLLHEKARRETQNARSDFLQNFENSISELKNSLEKFGYISNEFIRFLEYLIKKCSKDKKHI